MGSADEIKTRDRVDIFKTPEGRPRAKTLMNPMKERPKGEKKQRKKRSVGVRMDNQRLISAFLTPPRGKDSNVSDSMNADASRK